MKEAYRCFKIKHADSMGYSHDWFIQAIDFLWDNMPRVTDWLGFEQFTRDVLESDLLSDEQRVSILSEAIGAFTGRGKVEK